MMDNSPNKFCNKYDNIQHENLPTCNCCPFGYHIDLGFLQYVESLANFEPSDGELLRRDKRRSRLSKEFMLGMEGLYLLRSSNKILPAQEVLFECETESYPKTDKLTSENIPAYTFDNCDRRTNSLTETTAFVHDALDDVVSDFELTLERTKKKQNKKQVFSWIPHGDAIACRLDHNIPDSDKFKYIELTKSDSSPLKMNGGSFEEYGTSPNCTPEQSLVDDLNEFILENERKDRMEDEQNHLKDLALSKNSLSTTGRSDNSYVDQSDNLPPTPPIRVSSVRVASQFTPQRISPVSLECLSSRLKSNSQKTFAEPLADPVIKRDVSTMCDQINTDIVENKVSVLRSVGTSPVNTFGINDVIYTKIQVDEIIRKTLKQQADEFHKTLAAKAELSKPQPPEKKVCYAKSVQTTPEKVVLKISQSIMVRPTTKDMGISNIPKTRDVACSDHKTTDLICDKCISGASCKSCEDRKQVEKEPKTFISLNQMDTISHSLTNSLNEKQKLSLTRNKSIGIQCKMQSKDIATQSTIQMNSVSVQNSPISLNKSSQYMPNNVCKQTDTDGLITLASTQTLTDVYPVELPDKCLKCSKPVQVNEIDIHPTKISKKESGTNTVQLRTREFGTNTLKNVETKNSYSNTDIVSKRDKACGELIKPHILISCADNYCDSCKDAIKSLAKNFTKVLANSVLSGNNEQSKIPRPITIPSPGTNRKVLMRQSTYTLDSPPESPTKHKVSNTCVESQNQTETAEHTENENLVPENTTKQTITTVLTHSAASSNNEEYLNKKVSILDILCPTEVLSTSTMKDGITISDVLQKDDVEKEIPSESLKTKTTTPNMIINDSATSAREKCVPTKEMRAALKVIHDSLQKNVSSSTSKNLKSANAIVQKEWFKISSTNNAKPLDVEDYLDCFEEISTALLQYMVNIMDTNGNTAMHYAVSHGNFDVVSILLDSKVCNVNQVNNAGYTCVMLVSLAKLKNSAHRTVVQRMFQLADVNIRAKKHCQTALMLAVSHGNLDMVEMMLAAGADINIQDEDGSTSLMCAAEHGRADIVKHLLSQQDCDSLIQDIDGSTAFKIAWQAGHRDIGLLLYVHEQMLRSKVQEHASPVTARYNKHFSYQNLSQSQPPPSTE